MRMWFCIYLLTGLFECLAPPSGSVTRRPCFCAPYHYRLDWNIWFIGFKPHTAMLRQRERWLYSLLSKLLQGDAKVLELLDQVACQPSAKRPSACWPSATILGASRSRARIAITASNSAPLRSP